MKNIRRLALELIPKNLAPELAQHDELLALIEGICGHRPSEVWIKAQTLYIKSTRRQAITEIHYAQRRILQSPKLLELGIDKQKTILASEIPKQRPAKITRDKPPQRTLELAADHIEDPKLAKILRELARLEPPKQ